MVKAQSSGRNDNGCDNNAMVVMTEGSDDSGGSAGVLLVMLVGVL